MRICTRRDQGLVHHLGPRKEPAAAATKTRFMVAHNACDDFFFCLSQKGFLKKPLQTAVDSRAK